MSAPEKGRERMRAWTEEVLKQPNFFSLRDVARAKELRRLWLIEAAAKDVVRWNGPGGGRGMSELEELLGGWMKVAEELG